MSSRVVFYKLAAKIVDQEPESTREAADILYYALSVGHHTGVMDCFVERLSCPSDRYAALVEMLPESPARYKLEGIMRFGEIQIDRSHLRFLRPAIGEVARKLFTRRDANPYMREIAWLADFFQLLEEVDQDASSYIMGRRCDD